MPDLNIDRGVLKSSAAGLEGVAKQLEAAVKAFEAEITGHGEPWGYDDIGTLIGVAHQAVFEAAMECFTTNGEDIATDAGKLKEAAATYAESEKEASVEVNRVREFL
jgi:hypothetical protein